LSDPDIFSRIWTFIVGTGPFSFGSGHVWSDLAIWNWIQLPSNFSSYGQFFEVFQKFFGQKFGHLAIVRGSREKGVGGLEGEAEQAMRIDIDYRCLSNYCKIFFLTLTIVKMLLDKKNKVK
jgi:hypothetical protein